MSNFVNEDFVIDFEIPDALKEEIDMIEKAERDNDVAKYVFYQDILNVLAKNCCTAGIISNRQYNIIDNRYI